MAEETLVTGRFIEFERFARKLEASAVKPRAIIYATYSDTNEERLLIVAATKTNDEREIYRQLSILISTHRDEFQSIDISDMRVVPDNDSYIKSLSTLFRVESFSTISVSKSIINCIYIEHVVIFRLSL